MKRKYYTILCFSILANIFASLFIFSTSLQAQELSTKLDTNKIQIGDQVNLRFKISHGENINIQWPAIPDSLGKIEIVKRAKIDTIKSKQKIIIESQSVTLTAFDSGNFVIPSIRFLYTKKDDTTHYILQSDSLVLHVNMLQVDTAKAIRDIKPPIDVPFSWQEALPYIAGGLAVLCIAALLYYLIKKYRKPAVKKVPVVIRRPAHELAMEALKQLEKEKLWQEGQLKTYYSRLSDILRTYIEGRFNVPALEQTTEEILLSLKTSLAQEEKLKLKQVLELADLVKFAKAHAMPVENKLSLSNAYAFVQQTTKPEVK